MVTSAAPFVSAASEADERLRPGQCPYTEGAHPRRPALPASRFSFPRLAATLSLFALLVGASGQASADASGSAAGRLFTFQDLYGPGKTVSAWGEQPRILRWTADGAHYLQLGPDPKTRSLQIVAVSPRTGAAERWFDAAEMEKALQAAGAVKPDVAGSLREGAARLDNDAGRLLVDAEGSLWVYERAANRAVAVTRTGAVSNASFSPDGRWVACVRDGNLLVAPADGSGPERALTTDGGPLLYNGRLDWVYEEEIYGRGHTDGYAWSPDSRRIAFLRTDESPVKPFPIVDPIPHNESLDEQRYPLAGDPNPVVTLGVSSVADPKAPVRFVDTSAYPDQDRLLVRFGWTPDSGRLVYEVQNRTQTYLDLRTVSADGAGASVRLLRETTPAWVDGIDLPLWLKDGSFLWQSDRTGHRHLYHYRADGTLIGPVTQGEWDIHDVYGADEKRGLIYFSANERQATGVDAYRTRLGGGSAPERLTHEAGTHAIRLDPTFSFFLDTWSDLWTPPRVALLDTDRHLIRVLGDNAPLVAGLKAYRLSRPDLMTVRARDGFPLDAILIRPVDFDPKRRYPVYCDLYGGPGLPTVRDSWKGSEYLWYQFLAQNGYVVWLCDNRSASGRGGAGMQWTVYKNAGAAELRDVEDGIAWLKGQPWVDGNRIALSGWSYGGFMVEYALTHSKTFKVGIAGAGVSDWRLYDTVYTERYMDLPAANPDGYTRSAPVNAAGDLSGRLFLIHGLADDNVHLQNTTQLLYALERAGKPYDLALYPRSRHGIGDPVLYRHLQQRVLDYLRANL